MSKITSSIITKWKRNNQNGHFIRFIDGNKQNISISNLQWVTPHQALIEHFHDWVTDWDADLTRREIMTVCKQEWRDGLLLN